MMNGMGFRSYQPMNMVHRTKDGTELWLGDYMAASNLNLLRQKNIRHVLTSAAMLDVSYSKEHGINHKVINAFDIPSYKMTPHFEEAYLFIQDALKKGNILVHCAAGISRSTTFVLVYLMRGEKMGFQQAMGYVRSKRSVICPNYGFQNELKKYELNLKKIGPNSKEQPPRTAYQSYKQKKSIFEFEPDQKKRPLAAEQKLSSTTGGRVYLPQKNYGVKPATSNYPRGKSLNYTQKQRLQMYSDYKSSMNRLAEGLTSFKLQVPRVITIKK